MSEAVNELTGQVRRFGEICETEKLELPSKFTETALKEDMNQKVLRQSRRTTRGACVLSVSYIVIYVESELLTNYEGDSLVIIYDGYIAEGTAEFGAVRILGSDVQVINIGIRSSVQPHYCYIILYQGRKCRIYKKRSCKGKLY